MSKWKHGRWWRVTKLDNGKQSVWCETSDKAEAVNALIQARRDARIRKADTKYRLERLWFRHEEEWRTSEEFE